MKKPLKITYIVGMVWATSALPGAASSLLLEHAGTLVATFRANGIDFAQGPLQKSSGAGTQTGQLVIQKAGEQPALWTTDNQVNIKGSTDPQNLAGSLKIGDPLPQASPNSSIYVTPLGDLTMQVARHVELYLDDYTREGDYIDYSDLARDNLSASFGDGRVEFMPDGSHRVRYYVKDHLGSTRAVLRENATLVEAVRYSPYGEVQELGERPGAEIAAYEKFTGKELDQQGAVAKISLNFVIGGFTQGGNPPKFSLSFDNADSLVKGNLNASVENGNLVLSSNFLMDETGAITSVRLTVPGTDGNGDSIDYTVTGLSYAVQPGTETSIRFAQGQLGATSIPHGSYTHTAGPDYYASDEIAMGQIAGMGLEYFGARYYDPEIGAWLNPDKANQFWNSYAYSSNPIIYVDENGNWFGIDDLIAAGLGFVVGYVGHGIATGDWGSRSLAYGAIGAATGLATLYTAGAASAAVAAAGYGGFGAAVATGAITGAVGGFVQGGLTYTEQAAYGQGGYSMANLSSNWDVEGFGQSLAVSGGVGAAAGGTMAGLAYTGQWAWNNYGPSGGSQSVAFSEGKGDVPTSPKAEIRGTEYQEKMEEDFRKFDAGNKYRPLGCTKAESGATYRAYTKWWNGRPAVQRTWGGYFSGPETDFPASKLSSADFAIHSHPTYAYFSRPDYIVGHKYLSLDYLLAPDKQTLFMMSPYSNNFFQVNF